MNWYGEHFSVEELAAMMADIVLKEPMLKRETLIPKFEALIRTMVKLKNTPDYRKSPGASKNAARLLTIEKLNTENTYWHNIVKSLQPERMPEYYKELDKKLVVCLMVAGAEAVSETPEAAAEYLRSQGLDPEVIAKEGLRQIKAILDKK